MDTLVVTRVTPASQKSSAGESTSPLVTPRDFLGMTKYPTASTPARVTSTGLSPAQQHQMTAIAPLTPPYPMTPEEPPPSPSVFTITSPRRPQMRPPIYMTSSYMQPLTSSRHPHRARCARSEDDVRQEEEAQARIRRKTIILLIALGIGVAIFVIILIMYFRT